MSRNNIVAGNKLIKFVKQNLVYRSKVSRTRIKEKV